MASDRIKNPPELSGIAAVSRSADQIRLWSLVLHAACIPHAVLTDPEGWRLSVAAGDEFLARHQISVFEEENKNWPPVGPEPLPQLTGSSASTSPVVLIMGGLMFFYFTTGSWSAASPWFAQGAVAGRAILEDGQWYRLLTGLTLHSGPAHLLGNLAFGGVLLHYLCRQIGSGVALALLLAVGGLGNLLNILMRGGDHLSVGFSTAVFGMVGLLSGIRMVRGGSFKDILLPLGGGAGLLAFLGTGGERTDLGAHLWGLAVGLLPGLFVGRFSTQWAAFGNFWWQRWLFICCLFLVGLAWWFALGTAPVG